jgi:hypothetical protein
VTLSPADLAQIQGMIDAGASVGDGFDNPVVAGVQLVIPAIESPDYVPGVSGWAIFRNGTVEFNSGTFRGTITASEFDGTDFILDTDGFYLYSGPPALGNLVLSITNNAAPDRFGNVVKAGGLATYSPATGFANFLGNRVTGGTAENVLQMFTGDAAESTPGEVIAAIGGAGLTRFLQMFFTSPSLNVAGHQDTVGILYNSPAADGSSTANGVILYVDTSGSPTTVATWDNTGLNVKQGSYVPSDGQQYVFGHATTALAAGVAIANGVTSFFGSQFSVEAGVTYRCKMIAKCIQGAAAVAQFIGFSGVTTGGGTTQLFFKFIQDGTAQSYSIVTTQSNIGFMTSAAYVATRTFYLEMEGMFTPNAAGVVQMTARGNGGAFTVSPGTFFEIWRT